MFDKRLLKPASGFPDMSPAEAVAFRDVEQAIRAAFELAGFAPLETSVVERPQVLFEKTSGEIATQVYGLRLLNPPEDAPDDAKDLALRFDHTVPLARYVASHLHELEFPYRRYVIGPVFRGERPKDGRYRQFTQADIDVIGDGALSFLHDAEIVSVIERLFVRLNIGEFTIRIGHRKVLQGLLERAKLTDAETQKRALAAIDRLDKDGKDGVIALLVDIGVPNAEASRLIDQLTSPAAFDDLVASTDEMPDILKEGVEELQIVMDGVRELGVSPENYLIDLSIARGLDYYTGTVYETRLDAHHNLGSIASGGRYDDLAGAYINRSLPGVGISIGVTRLVKRLIKAGLYPAERTTAAPVLVVTPESSSEARAVYLQAASRLRSAGIATELYLEPRKLGKQMQFADRRGFRVAVIARADDIENGMFVVRNLVTGDQVEVPSAELPGAVKGYLES